MTAIPGERNAAAGLAAPVGGSWAGPVARLVAIFRTDDEVARVLGVPNAALADWRRGETVPMEHQAAITGLVAVTDVLAGYLEPSVVAEWLQGSNQRLGGLPPVIAIRHGRLSDVLDAVEAEKAGAFV